MVVNTSRAQGAQRKLAEPHFENQRPESLETNCPEDKYVTWGPDVNK